VHWRDLVEVRTANIDDSAGLAKVQVDSYRTAYAGIFPQAYLDRFTYEEQEQDWHSLLSTTGEDELHVAVTDAGEIVGYVLGKPCLSDTPPYDSELIALHVRRSHQGQGIGRQLVRELAGQLKHRGCGSLMLWVLEANASRTFYEELGGQLLSARKAPQGAVEVAYGWASIESLCEAVRVGDDDGNRRSRTG
jgi:ribosomal protein S18 acetylase RimI-like enzyme